VPGRRGSKTVSSSQSKPVEWCPTDSVGIGAAFWTAAGSSSRYRSAYRLSGKIRALVYWFPGITGQIRTAVRLSIFTPRSGKFWRTITFVSRGSVVSLDNMACPSLDGGPQGEGCFLTSSLVFLPFWFPQLEDGVAVLSSSHSLWSQEASPSQIQHYTLCRCQLFEFPCRALGLACFRSWRWPLFLPWARTQSERLTPQLLGCSL